MHLSELPFSRVVLSERLSWELAFLVIDDQLEASRMGAWIDDQLEASRTGSWIDDQLEAYQVEVYLIHPPFCVMEPLRVF